MIELFRFFRVGIVNLVGVTLPGLLTLFFFGVGFILPLVILVFDFTQRLAGVRPSTVWAMVDSLFSSNKGIIISLTIILSYIIGYIIRLSTPDELDRISAKNVLQKMGEELAPEFKEALKKRAEAADDDGEKFKSERILEETDEDLNSGAIAAAKLDRWPYQGEKTNKFPYYHFKQYLNSRGLVELAELVKWGDPKSEDEANSYKRSKTWVNLMKLEVGLRSPELSSVIESNEAHVRLLFGTWQAITTSRRFVIAGLVLSFIGPLSRFIPTTHLAPPSPSYIICILIGGTVFVGITWAKNRIENLFHYQRVRELTHIIGCAHYADKYKMLGNNQSLQEKIDLENRTKQPNPASSPEQSIEPNPQ
ncbi:MAG TPA: hypothetical protein VEQ40_07875 [Pyrinomonadaceae bacterium]|nr:hypothetical protein [Pyrinomonadaceae bacterium]